MFTNFTRRVFCLGAAGFLLSSVPAFADTVAYMADLNAASETPATASKGTGSLTAAYDTATKMLTWKGEYKDLSGDAKAAHFHGPAPVGKAAAPVIPIDASKSPFQGSTTLTDAQAADLAAGMWYVNIHTAANPGGEIRGQVVKGK